MKPAGTGGKGAVAGDGGRSLRVVLANLFLAPPSGLELQVAGIVLKNIGSDFSFSHYLYCDPNLKPAQASNKHGDHDRL
jgi:hypothetical protein